ncbi:hypothetical protein GGI15_004709 [Coemansia interrupta]|uniref:Uncharacterized protein n=1 Tax=Coemansia interrupta TaxID=1126814 RepID=A0A9W8LFI9_9FUNG|nr:hypothetical protein GGI15_004709 [Coemansia interrupta]
MAVLQSLPFHIVLSIVDSMLSSSAPGYFTSPNTALPILHTCQALRTAFLKRTCSTVLLELGKSATPSYRHPQCAAVISPLTHTTAPLVTTFLIESRSWNYIVTGNGLAWILSAGELCFSSARALEFQVGDCVFERTLTDAEISTSIVNIEAFLRNAKKMAPHVRSVQVRLGKVLFALTKQHHREAVSSAVAEVMRGVRSVGFDEDSRSMISIDLTPKDLAGLTDFKYEFRGGGHAWFAEIVRHNAGTLRSLRVKDAPRNSALELLSQSHGPVVYPVLETLVLENVRSPDGRGRALGNGALGEPMGSSSSRASVAHFPALRTLRVTDMYPFPNNVLLQGRNTTLEHLEIPVARYAAWPDIRYPPFDHSELHGLKTLVVQNTQSQAHFVHADGGRSNSTEASVVAYLRSLLSHSSAVKRVDYGGQVPKGQLCPLLGDGALQSIRVLTAGQTSMSFSRLVRLLQRTPQLRRLTIGLDNKEPEIDGVEATRIQEYIATNLSPLNGSVVHMELNMGFGTPACFLARIVGLLAIGCPGLSTFEYWPGRRSDLRRELEQLAEKPPYSAYAGRLRAFVARALFDNGR